MAKRSSTRGGRTTSRRASQSAPRTAQSNGEQRKVRYAVIGLGHIAQAAMLPAFAHAKKNSELAALVSDDDEKLKDLGARYGVSALYNYRDLDACLRNGIDAVYIATPNTEHAEFVHAAADAGVHVLCEKPLGVTERECLRMIRACERSGVQLMTAYRLHFEAANLAALKAATSGTIGEPRIFTSVFTYQISDVDNIRLRADLGGGPLHDIGIYCINAARMLFQAEPVAVHGWTLSSGDRRFREVDEAVAAHMRFPGGRVASFVCGFGAATASWYQLVGTKGDVRLDPAYEYTQALKLYLTVDEKTTQREFAKRDQFAAELLAFSDCILQGKTPEPSGWEGLADVRVIRAIQQSIERGEALELPAIMRARYAQPEQRIDRPAIPSTPRLVHARSASE